MSGELRGRKRPFWEFISGKWEFPWQELVKNWDFISHHESFTRQELDKKMNLWGNEAFKGNSLVLQETNLKTLFLTWVFTRNRVKSYGFVTST